MLKTKDLKKKDCYAVLRHSAKSGSQTPYYVEVLEQCEQMSFLIERRSFSTDKDALAFLNSLN